MKYIIFGKKVYNRNENVLYPNCHICGKELSPFAFKSEDISTILMAQFEKAHLVLKKGSKEIIILMCKTCCKLTKMEE